MDLLIYIRIVSSVMSFCVLYYRTDPDVGESTGLSDGAIGGLVASFLAVGIASVVVAFIVVRNVRRRRCRKKELKYGKFVVREMTSTNVCVCVCVCVCLQNALVSRLMLH